MKCAIPECNRFAMAKKPRKLTAAYCKMHYTRNLRHGSPFIIKRPQNGGGLGGANITPVSKLVPYAVNIRYRSQKLGLTQKELAAKAGIHYQTLTLINQGHETRLSTLFAIAAALECEAWQILKPGHFNALD